MDVRIFSYAGVAAMLGALACPADASTLRDLGAAPPAVAVRVAVVLRYRDPALEQLVDAQADPSSPVFHHFLSPAQFRDAFEHAV